MNHIIYPHQFPFQTLARQATRSSWTTNQTAATTISSRVAYPRTSSIIPLAQQARAESQHVPRATSAAASSPKKRKFGDFARGEEVEVAREDIEIVDAPPIEQDNTEQRITVSDVLPEASRNRNFRPIVFKSASAHPRPSPFGKAKVTPAAPLPTPVLGLELARRHWSVEPTEEWVVQPKEATAPAAWPQKVLYSGVSFVGTVAAFSGMKLRAIAVGGWRGARSFYQNRGQIGQECSMAVVTGYNSAKRRLVTLRTRVIPAQQLWRRRFDSVVQRNGHPRDRRFLWQRNPGQEDAMEDVRSTDEVFVTPPTTRFSTPDEVFVTPPMTRLSTPEESLNEVGPSLPADTPPRTYLNEADPSLSADTRPRTYWASDRGFQMGERRGPRRPSEDSDASEMDEYLWDESPAANIERVEELLASPIRSHIPILNYSPSPAIKEEPNSLERRSSPSSEGEVILPSIETDEQDSTSPGPAESQQLLQPAPPAPATDETARATPRRDLANGISEAEVSACMEWVASLGRRAANQKEGDTPKFLAFDPAFYTSLRKTGGAKSVKTRASERLHQSSLLLDVEQVFIPVLTDKHWSLLVVSPKAKTINYYDSRGASARPHIRLVKAWLAQELGKAYRERDWSTPSGSRGAGPRLAHRADCGIIACMTARMLVLGRDPMALDCSAEVIGDLWTGMKAEVSGGGGVAGVFI